MKALLLISKQFLVSLLMYSLVLSIIGGILWIIQSFLKH